VIGKTIGPYHVTAKLGEGGMGQVFRARDTRLGRDVAIKVLPPDVANDADRLARFNEEARATAALNHPNILAVFDVGAEGGVAYLVTEILDGRTLREVLAAETIPLSRVIDLAGQVADGLAAAHARGIVHRDLKPENIFVTTDGRAKILDFGLAKSAEPVGTGGEAETRAMTAPYVVLGSIGYIAPEQVRGFPADHRSDIFAFGCVLYEMLGGGRAFAGETPQDWMIAVTRDAPAPLVATATRPFSPLLLRIVDRCLEKAPAARFQSTTDLAFALKGLTTPDAGFASGAHVVGNVTASGHVLVRAPVRPAGWRIWIPWAITAIVVVASGLAFWRMRSTPVSPKRMYHMVLSGGDQPFRTGQNWEMFALSADGTRIVYSLVPPGSKPGAGGGTSGPLYVRKLDEAVAKPIPGTDGGVRPILSPDGQSLVFTDATNTTLKRVPIDGGTPTVVANNLMAGGTWARDNTLVVGSRGLRRVALTGGTPTPILSGEAAGRYTHPYLLPDGSILFTSVGSNELKVGVLPAGAATPKELVDGMHPRFIPPEYLIFARGGTLFAATFDPARYELTSEPVPVLEGVLGDLIGGQSNFSVSDDGSIAYIPGPIYGSLESTKFVWLDRTGQNETPLLFKPQAYGPARLSSDGKTMASGVVVAGATQLWTGDVARGTQLLVTTDAVSDYRLSNDGSRVEYRKADGTLWTRPIDLSGSETRLTNRTDLPGDRVGQVSPDGRWRVLTGAAPSSTTGTDIWVLNEAERDQPAKPWVQTPTNDQAVAFSPDGRWLLYTTADPSSVQVTRNQLFVQAFPGPGPVMPVTTDYMRFPALWADSDIVFRDLGGGTVTTLMAAHVTSGPKLIIDPPRVLMRVQANYTWDDVTRDAQRFLFRKDVSAISERNPATELHVIVNWIEDVKAKLAAAKAGR
jgi:Tol biopolymer transport system component